MLNFAIQVSVSVRRLRACARSNALSRDRASATPGIRASWPRWRQHRRTLAYSIGTCACVCAHTHTHTQIIVHHCVGSVLMASLSALEHADDDALHAALPGLVAMAARTQHTFAYTLAVLRRVASALDTDADDALLLRDGSARAVAAGAARLARELEQRAEHRCVTCQYISLISRARSLLPMRSVPATTVALRLANIGAAHSLALSSVALMTSANATNPSDIIQVRIGARFVVVICCARAVVQCVHDRIADTACRAAAARNVVR
jgi:hypothetical protein